MANVDAGARAVLLGIGIPLISLATGIQLINSVPHAIVDAKNYIKNSGQPPTPQVKPLLESNTTELPEFLRPWVEENKVIKERLLKVDKQLKNNIEMEAAKLESPQKAAEIDIPETPNLEDVVFPEETCEPCEELKMVVDEDDKEATQEE